MKKLVIDSSVIVKWLSSQDEEHVSNADKILMDVENGKAKLFTSELAKYEIANVLLKGKKLNIPQAKASLRICYSLPIEFISETKEQSSKSYAFAHALNITYYDAVFM